MCLPILLPLNKLEPYELFTIYIDGDLLPDLYAREKFEFLRIEDKNAICFTTEKVVNSSFSLWSNLLVFPYDRNWQKQIQETKETLLKLQRSQTQKKAITEGVLLSKLNISDRFHLSPNASEQYLVMHEINEHTYWVFSDRGNGKSLKKDTLVYVK